MSNRIDTEKILQLFLEDPQRKYHLREIARLVRYSPTSCAVYLHVLLKKKLIIHFTERGFSLFKADTDSLLFKEYKKHDTMKKIIESGLLEKLVKTFQEPDAVLLFGSSARGEDVKESDIDLCVITPVKKEVNLSEFGKVFKKEIQLFNFSRAKLKENTNKELINNILNGIVLYGYVDRV